jgi:exosortase A
VALLTIASCFAVLGVFWESTVSTVATWTRSNTFAHGFLIVPVCAYLIWTRRRRVSSLDPVPNLWGLPLLVGLGFGWLLGNLANVQVVQQFAEVAMLPGLVWTVLGTAVTRALLFPLAFVFFAVPMGEALVPPLQDFTAFFSVTALQLSGIPVFREGRIISVPSGTWHVAEACSGIRYLIAAVPLGCLYASITYQRWKHRFGFVLASVVAPIVANGVRVYGIILLGHLTENQLAARVDHLLYGWLFFGLVVGLLFWVGSLWREPVEGDERRESTVPLPPAVSGRAIRPAHSAHMFALTAVCGVALLSFMPLAAHLLWERVESPTAVQAVGPDMQSPWRVLPDGRSNWKPLFIGAAAEVMQSYTDGTRSVQLYVAYYAKQRRGGDLISSANVLVNGTQWIALDERPVSAVVDGRLLQVHETFAQSPRGTRLVWNWYWVASDFTSSPYYVKFLQVKARLLGGPPGAVVIALAADDEDRVRGADTLQSFLRHTSSLQPTLHGFARR